MSKFIAVVLLMAISIFSQTTPKFDTTYDEVEGVTTIATEVISVCKTAALQMFLSISDDTEWVFWIIRIVNHADDCMKEGGEVNILFVDGTRMSLKNNLNANCEGQTSIVFGEKYTDKELLKQLIKKRIKVIRFRLSPDYVDHQPNIWDADELRSAMRFLYKAKFHEDVR